MLKLYNSLTGQKKAFKPIRKSEVGVYSCGPTVYDHVHIGNLRSFITADVLVRTLHSLENFSVNWVINITDVDDKMIDRAAREFAELAPKDALAKLADKYTDYFIDGIERVGIARSSISKLPRATDNIAQMQAIIQELVRSGVAYVVESGVYFSLSAYQQSGQKYGVLTNLNFDAQARVIDDQDQKEGVGDFALWKVAKPNEPSWDFELDGHDLRGRPGWHIECSAMSTEFLGRPFDIHTGGVDLKFPHHENEIAQSGGKLANVFIHNEHLSINNEKMSKSLANIKKIDDIKDPLAFRLLCLLAHYRSHMDFTDAAIEAARNRLQALRNLARKNQFAKIANLTRRDNDKITQFKSDFNAALEDDLNTPKALAAVAGLETEPLLGGLADALAWADQVLGLDLVDEIVPFDDEEINLQKKRDLARKNKDFAASDALRGELSQIGIESEDLHGTTLYWRSSRLQ